MTREDLERRLESAEKQMSGLQDEIQNLKAKLAEVQDEPEIPDMPVFYRDEQYWWMEDSLDHINNGRAVGSVAEDFNNFHIPEMAQEFAEKCKLIAMMLHCKWYLCRDFKEDFSKDDLKWYAYYAKNTSHFAVDYCVNDDQGSVYFDTEKNALKCADWLNAHKEVIANDA